MGVVLDGREATPHESAHAPRGNPASQTRSKADQQLRDRLIAMAHASTVHQPSTVVLRQLVSENASLGRIDVPAYAALRRESGARQAAEEIVAALKEARLDLIRAAFSSDGSGDTRSEEHTSE